MTRIRTPAFQRRFLVLLSLSLVLASLGNTALLFAQEKKANSTPRRADLAAVAAESLVEITTTGRKSGKPRTTTIWFIYDASTLR